MSMGTLSTGRWDFSYKTGSEGPRHDPYGFREFIAKNKRTGDVYTYHVGLDTWLKRGRELLSRDEAECGRFFEEITGFDPEDFDKLYSRATSRCRACGSKGPFTYQDGFPGEYFVVCGNCGGVVDTEFRESEII